MNEEIKRLLELAAKAAGYTLRFRDCDDGLPSIVEKEEGLWMPQDAGLGRGRHRPR